MRYTAFKFDPAWLAEETGRHKENVRMNLGRDDWLQFACEVIGGRLKKDPKKNYRCYGPYWWALKKVLLANGVAHGDCMDEALAEEYRGETDEETITAAEAFRDYYFATFFVYTNEFMLGGEDEDVVPWTLWDSDYEASRFRGHFAHLGLSEERQREWEEMAEFFGDDYLGRKPETK